MVMMLIAGAMTTTLAQEPGAHSFGVLRPVTDDLDDYLAAGVTRVALEVGWDLMEPRRGALSETYLAQAREQLAAYQGLGFDVVLDLGLQYPPDWVFDLPGETRFVDQYGNRWYGDLGTDVPNAVYNDAVRAAQAGYIRRALAALGPANFIAVRVGGLLQNEARYPSRDGAGEPDSFWAFDPVALARSPVPDWNADASAAEDAAFFDFYVQSLTDYEAWLFDEYQAGFSGEIQLLLPGWGLRPGDAERAVSSSLASQASRNDQLSLGIDFAAVSERLAGRPDVVLYSTYLDAPDQGRGDALSSPAEYLHKLSSQHGHAVAGENSGDDRTTSALDRVDDLLEGDVVRDVMWVAGDSFGAPGQATLSDYASVVREHTGAR